MNTQPNWPGIAGSLQTLDLSVVVALLVAVIAFVEVRTSGGTMGGVQPITGTGTLSAPLTEVSRVSPAPGSTVCSRPRIQVSLRLTPALRKDGVFDLSQVRLAVDGREVTSKAVVMGTLDFPQSVAELTYVPEKAFPLGSHRVVLRIASGQGPQVYTWTFVVAAIPCQEP